MSILQGGRLVYCSDNLEVKNNVVKFTEFHCTSIWNSEGIKEKQAEDISYESLLQNTEPFYQCCDDRNLPEDFT